MAPSEPFDGTKSIRPIRNGGYRQLSRGNIPGHEIWHLVYKTIHLNPGIDVTVMESLSGINPGTLRYSSRTSHEFGKSTAPDRVRTPIYLKPRV